MARFPRKEGRQPHHSLNWGGKRPGAGRRRFMLPETVPDVTPHENYDKPLDYRCWKLKSSPPTARPTSSTRLRSLTFSGR